MVDGAVHLLEDGQLGTFAFDPNGDATRTPFTIYRFSLGKPGHKPPYASPEDQGSVLDRVIVAPASLARPFMSRSG